VFFYICCLIVITFFDFFWMKFIGGPRLKTKISELFSTYELRKFAVILYAPIIEELIFRLPLKFNKRYLIISFTLFTFLISRMLIGGVVKDLLFSSIISILFLVFFIRIFKMKKVYINLYIFWKKNPIIIFYLTAFVFAFLHIFNYNASFYEILIKSHFIILPRFIIGLLYGLIRIKINTFASILMHSINNSMPYLFIYLFL